MEKSTLIKEFVLLKRTYPVSQTNRVCDGYLYILDNTAPKQRKEWKINARELQREIRKGERYIYEVGKESYRIFNAKYICFSNFAIIRKHIFKTDDE